MRIVIELTSSSLFRSPLPLFRHLQGNDIKMKYLCKTTGSWSNSEAADESIEAIINRTHVNHHGPIANYLPETKRRCNTTSKNKGLLPTRSSWNVNIKRRYQAAHTHLEIEFFFCVHPFSSTSTPTMIISPIIFSSVVVFDSIAPHRYTIVIYFFQQLLEIFPTKTWTFTREFYERQFLILSKLLVIQFL